MGKQIVPEFIQSSANPKQIIHYIQKLIDDTEFRKLINIELGNVQNMLGNPGASDRAAKKIINNG